MVEVGLGYVVLLVLVLVLATALRPPPVGVMVVALRGNPLRRRIALLAPVERRLTPLAQRPLP